MQIRAYNVFIDGGCLVFFHKYGTGSTFGRKQGKKYNLYGTGSI